MRRLLVASIFAVAACRTPDTAPRHVTAVPPGAEKAVRLTIVGTNDWHGWVMSQPERFPKGEVRAGGAATFASYLKVLREDNPGGVVLLDAGDLFQGTLMSNVTEGQVVVDAFNILGFDAAAIGNHEFDYGPVGPVSAATQPGMDPFGALKARLASSRFPLLSSNIYVAATHQRPSWLPGDGTLMLERKGLKIGIIGLTTPQTPQVTLPVNVATLDFTPLATEALASAGRLREQGADLVVGVVHAGGKCGDCTQPHDTSSCDTDTGEIFEMLRTMPEGTLDAVVAGHTHAQISHFVNGTPVMESYALGRYFGVMELYVDPETRKVLKDKTGIHSAIEICEAFDETTRSCDARKLRDTPEAVKPVQANFRGRPISPDATVLAAMRPSEVRVSELQNQDLGLTVPETLGRNYESESALGSFFADSMRSLARADVALLNPGGLRSDLKRGSLKYGTVYEVLPFDNAVATVNVTGAQLRTLLTAAYGSRKGVFQVSGLEVQLSRCPSPDRFKSARLANGKAIDLQAHYRVVMPDFLARGGDGLGPVLNTIDPAQVDLGVGRPSNLRDELVTWWQEHRETFEPPRLGRIAFVNDGSDCTSGSRLDIQHGPP